MSDDQWIIAGMLIGWILSAIITAGIWAAIGWRFRNEP